MGIIPQYSKSGSSIRQGAKRRHHTKEQAAVRPPAPARHGFLNHTFEPLVDTMHPALRHKAKAEREFYSSLGHLADLYGIPIHPQGSVYPYNLHVAFEQAKSALALKDKSLELRVIEDENHTACIATLKTFNTGYMYYIPVQPVWELLQDKRQRTTTNLLLSLFGLLYRKGVAYFRESDSFLCGQYEMLAEWLTQNPDEWEERAYLNMRSDCHAQEWYGNLLFKRMRHPYHSLKFGSYIHSYEPKSEWEWELKAVCEQFYHLFNDRPEGHYHKQITDAFVDDEDDYTMSPDCYLSFFWTDKDSVYESLSESLNNYFGECSGTLDPVAVQLFDKTQSTGMHDFYFEWRFLLLTDYLCTLLFKLT